MRRPTPGPWTTTLGFGLAGAIDLGLLASVPAYVAARLARGPTRDSIDRLVIAVAVWLLVVVGVGAELDATASAIGSVVVPGAITAGGIAGARMIARRRWLARVRAGAVRDVCVIEGAIDLADSVPLGVEASTEVIVRSVLVGEGAFRAGRVRETVAPIGASRESERIAWPIARVVLALAVLPLAAAMGTLALTIVEQSVWRISGDPFTSSTFHALALTTALLTLGVVLVATHAPRERWASRTVVLALPAGVLNGGIALVLACPGRHATGLTLPVASLLASLVSGPSALVIGALLAWMSVRARSTENGWDATRALAPFVIASGAVAMLGTSWSAECGGYGALALSIGAAMLALGTDRVRIALTRRATG